MMGEGEEFLLKWHDHHNSFFQLVEDLVAREQLCDVTLSCGDVILNAHSLMLSVCSPYFRMLLSESQHREKHHIIHLNGVSGKLMQQILVYMYRGEISIAQEELGPLIETARCLQIKGLSLASSEFPDSQTQLARKRPASHPPPEACKQKERKLNRKLSPVKSVGPEICNIEAQTNHIIIEEDDDGTDSMDRSEYPSMEESFREIKPNNQLITLPMLPKPLSILKTAETRTYLSKLIWLGNGGKRPQYGNPETKPLWWPQHVLPWEEMKKMGGRKSQELSHINYTEILKQCLAAGYEYFGYDPSTYFCAETSLSSLSQGGSEEESTEGSKVNGDDLTDHGSPEKTDMKGEDESDSGTSNSALQSPNGLLSTPPGLQNFLTPTPVMGGLACNLAGSLVGALPGNLTGTLPGNLPNFLQQPSLATLTQASAIAAAAAHHQAGLSSVAAGSLSQNGGGGVGSSVTNGGSGGLTIRRNPGLADRQDTQDPSIVCQ